MLAMFELGVMFCGVNGKRRDATPRVYCCPVKTLLKLKLPRRPVMTCNVPEPVTSCTLAFVIPRPPMACSTRPLIVMREAMPGETSTAPASTRATPFPSPSTTRIMPRWSIEGGPLNEGLPPSIAGLPGSGHRVRVSPPLF